jgi:hypothetical protein
VSTFEDIVLACLRVRDWLAPPEALHRLVAGRDLAGLAEAAEAHRAIGGVYLALSAVPDVDLQVMSALHERYHRGIAAHLRALGDLAQLAPALDAAGLPWLVVRGPVLAECVYERAGLRLYRSLDLIVPQEAFPAALRAVVPEQPGGAGGVDLAYEWHGHVLVGARYGTAVRLRWRLLESPPGAPPPPVPMDAVFAGARPATLNGIPVHTLGFVETLVHLAALAGLEPDPPLGWLKDVEQAVLTGPPDWPQVVECARAWGAAVPVGAGLRAASRAFALDVPPDIMRALAATGSGREARAGAAGPGRNVRPAPAESTAGAADPVAAAERAALRLLHLAEPPLEPLSPSAWDVVLQLVLRERVGPLVHRRLHGEQAAPATVRAILEHAAARSRAAAADAYAQLAELLRLLEAAGVEPLVLKGAALAGPTYGDAALRPFSDLDLLVRQADIDAADRALREAGYAISGGRPSEVDRTWRHGRGYFDPRGRRLPVDVHWRLAGYPNLLELDHGQFFARGVRAPARGLTVPVPSAADMIIALAVAFLREFWYGKPKLRYLRDVAEVTARHAVDWALVERVSDGAPLLRFATRLGLEAAAEMFGAPVPDAARARSARERWPRLARRLRGRVLGRVLRREHPLEAIATVAAMRWLDGDTAAGHARWLRDLLFVPASLAPSRRRWLRRIWEG